MANVQAGDRAVVVRDKLAVNLGKIVSVVERMVPFNTAYGCECLFDGILYDHPADGRLCWGIESLGSEFVFEDGGTGMTGVCDDACLKKLPDLKDEDEALPRDVAKPSAREVEFSRW